MILHVSFAIATVPSNWGLQPHLEPPVLRVAAITSNLPLKQLALSEQQGWDYPYSWIIRLGDINYCVVNRVRNAWEMTSFTMAKYPDILEDLPKGCEWAVGLADFDIVQDVLRKIESRGETLTGE